MMKTCAEPTDEVITDSGTKQISKVRPGDKVLTDSGEAEVIQVMSDFLYTLCGECKRGLYKERTFVDYQFDTATCDNCGHRIKRFTGREMKC